MNLNATDNLSAICQSCVVLIDVLISDDPPAGCGRPNVETSVVHVQHIELIQLLHINQ